LKLQLIYLYSGGDFLRECDLHRQIEETRVRLFETAAQYGLGNEKTIKVSQELDILLNYTQRKQLNKRQFSC
jgi:hypothetical protein